MLKTAKYKYIALACARFLALALLVGLPVAGHTQASGYFTLTNGRQWWFDGSEADADDAMQDGLPRKYPVAYDKSRGEVAVHPLGQQHVTLITEQGSVYFALDTSDADHPKFVARPVADGFDPLCAWYRTGYTGYYYQEWGGYRYYIVAEPSTGISIYKAAIGSPLYNTTYWYNWDFGAAMQDIVTVGDTNVEHDYWIMYDTLNDADGKRAPAPEWRLSSDCYNRPEDIYYTAYAANDADGNARRLRYYDDVAVPYGFDGYDSLHYPAGNGALFLPVKVTVTPMKICSMPTGQGLLGITTTKDELTLDESADLQVQLGTSLGDMVNMCYVPEIVEYEEETYRRGIHLKYPFRTEESFGSAGVATKNHWYYYNDTEDSPVERHTSSPYDMGEWVAEYGLICSWVTIKSIDYSIDRSSSRYMTIVKDDHDSTKAVLTCVNPPDKSHTVKIYAMVNYANGASQADTIEVTVSYTKSETTAEAKNGPVVRGSVFGGGRMARVGGNTNVTIHNADSIYALYGGNDIAGWVQGDDGATIQLGTEYTNEEHPVHIGWVYGGGCGYYTYQGINDGVDEDGNYVNPYFSSQSTSLIYQAYYFNGKVYPWQQLPAGYLADNASADEKNLDQSAWSSLTPVVDQEFSYVPYYIGQPDAVDQAEKGEDGDGTIPYIKTAHITVGVPEKRDASGNVVEPFVDADGHSTHEHNDYIVIDSLFGGAENAFIGVTSDDANHPENGVTIDINGGTIYSVFGGNNYGGSVANTSTVYVNVYDTKLVGEDDMVENSYYSGYGRDYGIRYLFGGGNKVEGSYARVTFHGGMVDTAFIGGNSASVKQPIGLVDCQPSSTANAFGHLGHYICTNPSYPAPSDVAAVRANPENYTMTVGGKTVMEYGPDTWEGEVGQYNIRVLFAGNNSADMKNLTLVQLKSGGISSVYGGGNVGDMTNAGTVDIPAYLSLMKKAFDIDPETGTAVAGGWADIFGIRTVPTKVGTIISALSDSKITCDFVYGGARMGNITHSCGIFATGGTFGFLNGGNDISGDIGSETGGGSYVIIDSNALVVGDVTGGSDGYYHCDDGTGHYDYTPLYGVYGDAVGADMVSYDPYDDLVGQLMPTQNNSNVYIRGGVVLGNVQAGGLHTDIGFANGASPMIRKLDATTGLRTETTLDNSASGGNMNGKIRMLLKSGTVYGNVFGGGYQSKTYGLAYLRVKGDVTIKGSLFAGNDCTGSINSFGAYYNPDDVNPAYTDGMSHEDSVTAYNEAFAAACQIPQTSDGTKLNFNNGSWTAAYDTYLKIEDTPTIKCVYGSGNGAYNYDGSRPEYPSVSFCDDGSGRITPLQSSTYIDINTSGGRIDTVFGGGNGVGVESNLMVLLNNTTPDVHTVHTIFGGNNRDDMAIVPRIDLKKGQVNTVFGGSNNGKMTALRDFYDLGDKKVTGVSTHVVVESEDATVIDTIFGGNRMSDIAGMTYVEIRGTHDDGVNTVFGGNDISGSIGGGTRIDVGGGVVKHIFGGSNGRYDFVEIGDGQFNVYPIGAEHTAENLITVTPRPDVDSANINIWGGTLLNDLYGGGSMADCRSTNVVLNDTIGYTGTGHATIKGNVFGGGMGMWEDLNARDTRGERYGNVTEATHVHLYHIDNLVQAKAYGGGRGGDVRQTYITAHEGWDKPFDQLFGGCWGSDVTGTAHVTVNGADHGDYNVVNLFGGNDFAGDVFKSIVTVNSGLFNNIYGGGNGYYADAEYTSGVYSGTGKNLHRPNTEYIEVTFNDGTVDSNLYGGGKLGTTWTYKKTSSGEYAYNDGKKVPATDMTKANAFTNPIDYSYIITNVHGGQFNGNIFAGAQGKKNDRTALVYGLKVLNMDNGHVVESIYGGSESANDGYAAECVTDEDYNGYDYNLTDPVVGPRDLKASNTSTRRPSSIINLTGGTIESNVYGAGYLGDVYGSTFVNIGTDAIDSCQAYTDVYPYGGSENSLYRRFKPGERGSLSPALVRNPIYLNHSVYAGANWGTGAGLATLTTESYHGGISSIHIDGRDYNTDNNELNYLPTMHIEKSVFGSGTSVAAGDLLSEITIRNYGALDACHPTKTLESVQRADSLHLHRTAIEYVGASNAASSFFSEGYAIKSVPRLAFRGYNVEEFDVPVQGVAFLNVYEENLDNGQLKLANLASLDVANLDNNTTTGGACAEDYDICDHITVVDPDVDDKKHTLLILNDGIDFIMAQEKAGGDYEAGGYVYGYSYATAPSGTGATIVGARNTTSNNRAWDDGMSGFVSPCQTSNKYTDDNTADNITWVDYSSSNPSNEAVYRNTLLGTLPAREWSLGDGYRSREVTILAHSEPSKINTNARVNVAGKTFSLAETTLTLPATEGGHYFRLNSSGVTIEGDNYVLNLVDSAWSCDATGLSALNPYPANVSDKGAWHSSSLSPVDAVKMGLTDIQSSPINTFGLIMLPDEVGSQHGNFAYSGGSYSMPTVTGVTADDRYLVFSGNSYVNSAATYCSPTVATGNVTPKMRLLLTYDSTFASAFLGHVSFILDEFDASGSKVNEVHVKVYISTVIDEFKDIESEVLAMYNAGRTNTFTRSLVLPATLDENRQLYITDIKWVPTNNLGTVETPESELFYLAKDSLTIVNAAKTPVEVNNLFRLNVIPSDHFSSVNTHVGWHRIDEENINLFELAKPTAADGATAKMSAGTATAEAVDLTDAGASRGLLVGTLDGRGEVGLNVQLTFDGTRTYPDNGGNGYLGKAVIGLKSYLDDEDKGRFTVTVYVKTRDHGDTIYLASAGSVSRGGQTVYPYNNPNSAYAQESNPVKKASLLGKCPNAYVTTFQEALRTGIYEEGDVIAIIDKVEINNGSVAIQGADGPPIEVIRYDGHHHQLATETGVYRDPMIVVSGANTAFTAKNISFHGGAGAFVKNDAAIDVKVPDTNIVFSPIIQVVNNGTVNLSDGTIVHHNWNGTGSSALAQNRGAVSVTDGGKLFLKNDVTFEHNLCEALDGDTPEHPLNGNIYLDGGSLILPESNDPTSAIDITHNYMLPAGTRNAAWWTANKWWTLDPTGTRFIVSSNAFDNWTPNNVFLTRTAPSTGSNYVVTVKDAKTDVLTVDGTINSASRIGISKWFPGGNNDALAANVRDTIRVAVSTRNGINKLPVATNNGVFVSDDDMRVFYNDLVNSRTTYYFRCSSFRHQLAGTNLPIDFTVAGKDVMEYGWSRTATCPTGGDSIFYRVQGGFMPYTFSWSGDINAEHTSAYPNSLVESKLNAGDYSYYVASTTDTLLIPTISMGAGVNDKQINLSVTATDATGECQLTKNIQVDLHKVNELGSHLRWEPVTSPNGWTDTNSYTATDRVIAKGDRYYEAVHITPYVWWDRNSGTISAVVPGLNNDHVYHYVEGEDRHELSDVLFCEGDELRLKTEPNAEHSDYKFIMWDFDPYSENPTTYYVPAHNSDVIAYYGPKDYWKDVINSEAEARAALSTGYYYTTRPNYTGDGQPASYVTTYQDDVHIYDEKGLAWFISVVNGLNGAQAREFFFNRVFIHQKSDGTPYNMGPHLWTPTGTTQHPFRGYFIGVGSDATTTTPLDNGDYVVIQNITVNEPEAVYAGFFGHLDSARVKGIQIETAMIRGAQYVGAMAAESRGSVIFNSMVDGGSTSTLLSTHYVGGGLVGQSRNDSLMNNAAISTKFVGDGVYFGGIAGTVDVDDDATTIIRNNRAEVDIRSNALYAGGIVGNTTDNGNDEPEDCEVPQLLDPEYHTDSFFVILSWEGYGQMWQVEVTDINQRTSSQITQTPSYYLGISTGDEYFVRVRAICCPNGVPMNEDGSISETADNSGCFSAWSDPITVSFPTGGNNNDGTSGGDGNEGGNTNPNMPSGTIANNYVHIVDNGNNRRMGGLVGHAQNVAVENNYVYGNVGSSSASGAVAAMADEGTYAANNYYEHGSTKRVVGQKRNGATIRATLSFSGSGNHVNLATNDQGESNLTLALNHWVAQHRAQGYLTWRSDLEGTNNGYPLFGRPDLIPIVDTIAMHGCDSLVYNGRHYNDGESLTVHVIDSVEMVDSISTIMFYVGHSTRESHIDTGHVGQPYTGYGFYLSPTETDLLSQTLDSEGKVTLVLTDTLSTITGCDSIVTLILTFYGAVDDPEIIEDELPDVKVWPNPTTELVHIDADGLQHVELYDNKGRTIANYICTNKKNITFNVFDLSTGVYYLRVHTSSNVTIQKLIKK